MNKEHEAKFLNIDAQQLRDKLTSVGAKLNFANTLFRRMIFDNPEMASQDAFVRLRDEEGGKVTLTYKKFSGEGGVGAATETEIVVDSFDKTATLLRDLGFKDRNYQESYREEWNLDGVKIDIDTWPRIPVYLEIEGSDEKAIMSAAEALGFDYKNAVFENTSTLYMKHTGIDIKTVPRLVFE